MYKSGSCVAQPVVMLTERCPLEKGLAHAQPRGTGATSCCAALVTENSVFSITHSLQEDTDQASRTFHPATLTLLGTNDYLS